MRHYILTQLDKGNLRLPDDAKEAYSFFNKALYSAELYDEIDLQGKALIGLAHASRNMGELGIGFKYAYKALALYISLEQQEGIARSYNFLGIFCFHSGLFQKALDHFYKAESLLDTNVLPPSLIISIFNNIAEVYQHAGNNETSLSYYNKAYIKAKAENLNLYEHSILNNMGKVFVMDDNLKKAEKYFRKALSHLEHAGDKIFLSEAHLNLSQALFKLKRFEEAHQHLEIAQSSLQHLNDTYYFIDILLTRYRYRVSDDEEGLSLLIEALELSINNKSKKKMMEIYQILSVYYETANDYKHSLKYYRLFHETESEINANHLRFQMDILLTKHHPNQLDDRLEKLRNIIPQAMDPDALKRKAHYDELTSLPNRYLIKMMLAYLQKTNAQNFWLGILDLDHFKWVNDGMGHLFGDECLIKTSNIISQMLLPYNGFVGRFGGEEFLIILPEIDPAKGKEILSDIIQNFHRESITYQYDQHQYKLTASIGAIYNESSCDDWKSLIELADKALYQAKAAGRDQLAIWKN
jgi:diguanylate cyclase (GGDEF)-like protein